MWPISIDDPTTTNLLRHFGVIPIGGELPQSERFTNVVDWLLATWSEHAVRSTTAQAKFAYRIMASLKCVDRRSAWITVTMPECDRVTSERWLGARVFWSTESLDEGPSLAFVSSQVGRREAVQKAWLQDFQKRLVNCTIAAPILVAVERTTAARFTERASRLFDFRLRKFCFGGSLKKPVDWFAATLQQSVEQSVDTTRQTCSIFVSPQHSPESHGSDESADLMTYPEQDRLLMLSARHFEVLALRPGGTSETLLNARLAETPQLNVRRPDEVSSDHQEALRSSTRENDESSILPEARHLAPTVLQGRQVEEELAEMIRGELHNGASEWSYLSHWTRALEAVSFQKLGDAEIDQMLRDPSACDRSAFGSLLSIVRSQRLKASRATLRGPVPMVCFSALPLRQLLQHRTYRTHRTRWDCEHYGLCFRHSVLQKLGAREVTYGTETDYERMPDAERLWFQLQPDRYSEKQIDWRLEVEWRLPGDLDLTLIADSDAFLFVPSEAERAQLREVTNWPIVTVSELQLPL